MYKNYLRTGWRNLTRNKVFSFINISGLALGMACSMLIALWVYDEYSIDAFHEHGDRIFVVTAREYAGAEIKGSYSTPGLLGEELKKIFPEVEYACNYSSGGYYTFAVEDRKMKLPGAFAGADFFRISLIAIFISCLGLLGLVIFSSIQRTKELGVRKVLGASTTQIVVLLSKDYMRLILVAFILSAPVAWYVMNGWLNGFEYHIDLEWWIFAMAAAGTMLTALLTISFNAVKAGLANPVKNLQSE